MTGSAGRGLTLALGVALGALGSALLFEVLERPAISVEASDAKPPTQDANASERSLPLPRAHSLTAT